MGKKLKNFFKSVISGCIGAGIFLMLSIFAFAIAKIVFVLREKDLLFSKFSIIAVMALFIVFGFVYGVRSFLIKNSYRKLLKPGWTNVLTNFIIAAFFAFIIAICAKRLYAFNASIKILAALFIVLFILFYLFSAILSNYLTPKRARVKTHRSRNALLFLLFNPIFIIIYLWLFSLVFYNSLYIPCNIVITGVEKNFYTANTASLGIETGEKILSIDSVPMHSLQDVKGYMNSLESTREISLETEKSLYYLKTYELEGKRYMGLTLKQEYCARKY